MTHLMAGTPSRPRVVILGGGFAGIGTALELTSSARRRARAEVHLISDENYFVFQPLLPEVVSCRLEPSHIVNPIRQLCPHVTFHCAAVRTIDLDRRVIHAIGRDTRRERLIPYEHLVLALGLTMDVSRIAGMSDHTFPIRTLGDAFALRSQVMSVLEEAEIEPDEAARRRMLTFVAVGGGFSGVETVAELNDMIKSVLRYYPNARRTGHRVVLIHSGERILNEIDPSLAEFAQNKLRERGVQIILNNRVSEATGEGVILKDGTPLAASTVLCTVGSGPHALIAALALPQTRGRIQADECLRVPGHDRVWALGDGATVPDVVSGGTCPPTAQYALRQGRRCAENILGQIEGRPPRPFKFGGLGQLAVVGHRCGVAQVMGWNISGFPAWFLWRSVYLMKLPGIRCKVRVGLDWALDLFFPRDITKLDMQRSERMARAHFRQGEIIIRQGEIGDRFYVIESGEVEVVSEIPGKTEQRLTTLGKGQSFGEVAILKDTPRTATVRCLTPVDVITVGRHDFQSLVTTSSGLRRLMDEQERQQASNTKTNDAKAKSVPAA